MFIVHGSWFRRNVRWLLGLVLLLLIPSFLFLYTQPTGTREGDLPTIAGRKVNPAEFERAHALVFSEMILNSGGQLPKTDRLGEMVRQETVMRLLLLQEARQFGLVVSDDEVVAHIRSQQAFRNEQGQFDPARYQQFVISLNNLRINESQFEEIMRQQILVERLEDLVTTAAKVTPQGLRQTFEMFHETLVVAHVALTPADVPAPAAPTDEELAAFYAENQEAFRTERKTQVRYVQIPADESAQTVSDEDVQLFYDRSRQRFAGTLEESAAEIRAELARSRAFYAAGDRATEFTIKLVPERGAPPPDFAAAAAALGLPVQTTEFFGRSETVPGVTAGPEFNQAAFALTPGAPISDPIEGEAGYYVLQFLGIQDSEIPPLADVRERVAREWTRQAALTAVVREGEALAPRVRAAVAAGQTFAAACAAANLQPVTSEPFTLADDSVELPAAGFIKETALGMRVGAVSDFIRTPTGGVFFQLASRTAPAAAEFEENKERYRAMLQQQQRNAIWQAWLQDLWQRQQVSL